MMSIDQVKDEHELLKGELSYKYQRLRERLRSAVKTGELAGKLPGERELARRFSANAKTINKALNDLAMEGLVLRHVGRGTFVAGPGAGLPIPAVSTRRIVWIVPSKSDAGDHSRLLSEARELLEIKGHRIDQLAMDLTPAGELEGTSLTYRELRQVDGVFLSARPSSQLLAGLRRRRIPVVMIDNHSETVRLPAVVVDQAHGAFALCEKCIQLGHVRIQVLACPCCFPAAFSAEAGYRAAMQHYLLKPLATVQVGPELDWSSLLAGETRPTAIISVAGHLAVETLRQAEQRGLGIPADLSIGTICRMGETCAAKDSITSYEADSGRMLNWVAELIAERPSTSYPPLVVVPGRLRDRGTMDRPKGEVARCADPTREANI